MNPNLTPRAPQGPSDAELNAIPPDPLLVPYGGSSNTLFALIAGPPTAAPGLMRGTAFDHSRVQVSTLERT